MTLTIQALFFLGGRKITLKVILYSLKNIVLFTKAWYDHKSSTSSLLHTHYFNTPPHTHRTKVWRDAKSYFKNILLESVSFSQVCALHFSHITNSVFCKTTKIILLNQSQHCVKLKSFSNWSISAYSHKIGTSMHYE